MWDLTQHYYVYFSHKDKDKLLGDQDEIIECEEGVHCQIVLQN